MANYSFTTEKSGAGTYPDGYDDEDRFMRYVRTGVSEDFLLARSDIGNISSFTLNGSTTTNRSYNNIHALTAIGGESQSYDADGNVTTLHTGVTVDWDDAGRVEATHVSSSATAGIEGDNEYGYLDGRKVWRKITRSSNVVVHEVYVYDGPNRIADYNASAVASSPAMQRVYDGTIDNLRAIIESNGDVLIPTRNRQWSIVSLTDNASGSVLERYAYDKFGKRTIYAANGSTARTTSNHGNYFGYTGQEELPESGLDYFKARHYDPATGEFLSKDPLLFVDGASMFRGYLSFTDVDPFGTILWDSPYQKGVDASWHWHHRIPWKYWDRCYLLGIDINAERWGIWLDPVTHRGLTEEHMEMWDDFFENNKNPTAFDIYEEFLDQDLYFYEDYAEGIGCTCRYPREASRPFRGNRLSFYKSLPQFQKVRINHLTTILPLLDPALRGVNLLNLTGGGCDQKFKDMKVAYATLWSVGGELNCQHAADALIKYLGCAGVSDDDHGNLRLQLFAKCSAVTRNFGCNKDFAPRPNGPPTSEGAGVGR